MTDEPSLQSRSAQLILLGGLPGSGKSKHVERLAAEGWTILDDFQKRAINNEPSFTMSRHLPALLEAVREGRKCVVADVRLVTAEYRNEALRALRGEFPALPIQLRIFGRDDAQCADNINNSPDPRDAPGRLRILAEFAPKHSIPPDALTLSVWRPSPDGVGY